MGITEAIEVLNTISADLGHSGNILYTCKFISENRSDFEPHEIQAYNKFMEVGRDFFADVEESV
jgi:hypothetical protein